MASPFELFRRNQIWVVVLFGLSMLAFVIFGAVQDPSNVPSGLWILAFGCIFAGVGWIFGVREQKKTEYAVGLGVLGVLMGVLLARSAQPAPEVTVAGEALSPQEVNDEVGEVGTANRFLVNLIRGVSPDDANPIMMQRMLQGYTFELPQDSGGTEDVAVRKALDVKADELGIVVTDEQIDEYLTKATQGNITSDAFTEARKSVQVSETELYELLRENIRRKQTFKLLNDDLGVELPVAAYYDLYRRLNEPRSIEAIEVPVAAFVDDEAEPSETEIQSLFAQYRELRPNVGPDGRYVAGQPGFVQPARMALGAIEIPFEKVKQTIPEPSEEELRAAYDAQYGSLPDAADLPDLEAAAAEAAELEKTMDEQTRDPQDEAPPQLPTDSDAGSDAKPEQENDQNTDQNTEEKAGQGTKDESEGDGVEASDDSGGPVIEEATDEKTSLWRRGGTIYPVVFQDAADGAGVPDVDPQALENAIEALRGVAPKTKPARKAKPDADEPKTDKPDTEKAEAKKQDPVVVMPADEGTNEDTNETPTKDAGDKTNETADAKPAMVDNTENTEKANSDATPAAPVIPDSPAMVEENSGQAEPAKPSGPPSFEEVREQLKTQIVEQKARERMRDLSQQTLLWAADTIAVGTQYEPGEDDYIDDETASEMAEDFAAENGLVYVEVPPMSAEEMAADEEYAITAAFNLEPQTFVPQAAERARDEYVPSRAISPQTGSQFVWWRRGLEPTHVPVSLDEPGVREQVVAAWRRLQARPAAEERALALAEEAKKIDADAPLAELASGQTITGDEGAKPLQLREAPAFTWMRQSRAPSPNPFMNNTQTERTDIGSRLGASVPLDDTFMQAVFDEAAPGDVVVAPDSEASSYWVVYVRPGEVPGPGAGFKQAPLFGFMSPYPNLSRMAKQRSGRSWRRQLLDEYDVQLPE